VTKKKKRPRTSPAPGKSGSKAALTANQPRRPNSGARPSATASPPVQSLVEEKPRAKGQAVARAIREGRDWCTLGVGAAVSLAALILYVLTAARDVVAGDSAEFLITAKTLGVAHAPGYPLIDFIGYLFSWLPVGSIAFRIDLFAVVCSTLTVAVVYATVWRLTSLRAPAAAAGLALAFTPLFWRWSLQIETFPLNNLLVGLIVYLLVRWHQQPTNRNYLLGAAFVFGLDLTNQQTVVFIVPAIVWVLWLHRSQLVQNRSTIGYAALAIVAGLIPYVYVPLAALGHSPFNWDDVHSFSDLVRLLFREDFGGAAAEGGGGLAGGNVITRSLYMFRGVGIVVAIVSLFGIVYAYRVLRWYFWFVVLSLAFAGVGSMYLANFDPTISVSHFVLERFFLLPLVLIAPLVGLGVIWIGEIVNKMIVELDISRATMGTAVAVVISSLVVVGLNYSTLDMRNDHVVGNFARDALGGLPPRTILFVTGTEDDAPTLFVNSAANVRPDVTVVLALALTYPWYVRSLRQIHQFKVPATMTILNVIRANPGRPVAFVGPAPDGSIDGKYYLYPDGLVSYVERVGHPILVTRDESDNKAQLARIHVPNFKTIKPDSLEPAILAHYASVPYRIGQAYALAGQKSEAIAWYRKALEIDPSFPPSLAAAAIKELGGTP
jgi:hypothetical protein